MCKFPLILTDRVAESDRANDPRVGSNLGGLTAKGDDKKGKGGD